MSEEIGRLRKAGQPADERIAEMRRVGDEIQALEADVRTIQEQIEAKLLNVPNLVHPDVPHGADESENVEVRRWGEPRAFDFEPKAHWDLGRDLGILDFERAAKITGARFTVFSGAGARLVRALINFMLDLHTGEHGYTRGPAALHGQPAEPDGHRAAAQVRGGPLQRGRRPTTSWSPPPRCR